MRLDAVYCLLHLSNFRLVGFAAGADPLQTGSSLTVLVQVVFDLKFSQLNPVLFAPLEYFN